MAITSNNSKNSVVQEIKKYTGVTKAKVIAINPTMSQAEKVGIPMRKEPVYKTTNSDTGAAGYRLDFHVKSVEADEAINKVTFFLYDEPQFNRAKDKKVFINNTGVSTWGQSLEALKENPKMNWFTEKEGVREAKRGEAELITFLIAWLNVKQRLSAEEIAAGEKVEAYLETLDSIITKGNLRELSDIFNSRNPDGSSVKENEVDLLYLMRENNGNWYQGVFQGFYGRASNRNYDLWKKAINQEYGGLRDNESIQNSLEFQEYKGDASVSTKNAEAKAEEEKTDDAPF